MIYLRLLLLLLLKSFTFLLLLASSVGDKGGSSLLFCLFNMVVMIQLDKHPEVISSCSVMVS